MLAHPNPIPDSKKSAKLKTRLKVVAGGVLSFAILFALVAFGFDFYPAPAALKAAISESEEVISPPLITSIIPLSGQAGDLIYINGKNFSPAALENTVKIGNKTAKISTVGYATGDTMTIVAIVPSIETAGDYPFTVTTVDGTAIGATSFTIIGESEVGGVPQITQLDPLGGAPKSTLYIHGTNFSVTAEENIVEFARIGGSTVQPIKVEVVYLDGERTLKVPVPPRAASGRVSVTVGGIVADSGFDFTVLRAATSADDPQITSLSSSNVEFGEKIVVKGKNLIDPKTGVTEVSVAFDEVAAKIKNFSVDLEGNDALLVEVPVNARSGYLTITRAGKTAFSPAPIIVLSAPIELETDITELIQPIAEPVLEPVFEPIAELVEPEAPIEAVEPISFAPDSPADLTAKIADGAIRLSWSAADLPTEYSIYYSTMSGHYLHRLPAGGTTEILVNENLSAGTRYFFVVTASDAAGHESEPSREVSVIAPSQIAPVIAAAFAPAAPPPSAFLHAAARPPQLSKQGPAETLLFAGILTALATGLFWARRKFTTKRA